MYHITGVVVEEPDAIEPRKELAPPHQIPLPFKTLPTQNLWNKLHHFQSRLDTMDSIQYRRSDEFPSEIWNKSKFPTQFRPRISKYASVCDDACWAVRDELAEAGVAESVAKGLGCVDSVTGNAIALVTNTFLSFTSFILLCLDCQRVFNPLGSCSLQETSY